MNSQHSTINCVVTTAPTSEPITLTEAKSYLKMDDDPSDDTLIESLIKAARIHIENRIGRSIVQQVRTQYMDAFPYSDTIELLYGPLYNDAGTTVRSVKYYDENDVLQTMSASDYWIDSTSDIPRIVCKTSWPSTELRPNAVQIEYNAGYVATNAVAPEDIRNAMWLYITHFYENRMTEISGTISKFEFAMDDVLAGRMAYQNGFYATRY